MKTRVREDVLEKMRQIGLTEDDLSNVIITAREGFMMRRLNMEAHAHGIHGPHVAATITGELAATMSKGVRVMDEAMYVHSDQELTSSIYGHLDHMRNETAKAFGYRGLYAFFSAMKMIKDTALPIMLSDLLLEEVEENE